MLHRLISFSLSLILLLPISATAQDGPNVMAITEAWLASPHAERDSEAFTHWNEDGEIPGRCAVCHSSPGALEYLRGDQETVSAISHPVLPGSVIECSVCHSAAAVELETVKFASGAAIQMSRASAVCSVCHQGRASTPTVNAAIGTLDADTVSAELGFINSHYALASATQQGTAAKGGYEYEGRTYVGAYTHVKDVNTCASCHRPHSTEVRIDSCLTCHKDVDEFTQIRTSKADFDGDGDVTEGIAQPIATLHARLGEAIRAYAEQVAGTPVIYSSSSYPYFFNDTDGNGEVTEGEAAYPNRYQAWTPRLLRAAYNYQFVAQDGGAFVHNPHYALQLLYDSLADLSGSVEVDMASLTRP